MKAVILAGGFGTRLSEETDILPKPLVEIGGKPIIWHIMQTYAAADIKEFVVCCGYKANLLKKYFAEYYFNSFDIEVDLGLNEVKLIKSREENWKVTLIDTGLETMTGGRLKRVRQYLNDTFSLTYGDGVADIDMRNVLAAHKRGGKLATVTAVQSPGRFGVLEFDRDGAHVQRFAEKPRNEMGWINAGYFFLEPDAINYVENDDTVWEREPLQRLAEDGQLTAYRHTGFWQPMDTLRDKRNLEQLWDTGQAPWKRP